MHKLLTLLKRVPVPFSHQKPSNPMKITITLAALLLPISIWAFQPASPPFIQGNIESIQQQAAEEGKLYFLHFTAEYVMTCKWMKEETFTDPDLMNYLQDSYLALEIDVNEPDGMALQHQYGITQLPTLLVFSTRGQLLGERNGTVAAKELLAYLRSFDKPANRVQPTAAQPSSGARPVRVLHSPDPILEVSMPRLVPDAGNNAPTASVAAHQPARPAPPAAKPPTRRVHETQARVEQPAHTPPSSYYTVQVGVYASLENAREASREIEIKGGQSVAIHEGKAGGANIYRLLAGVFTDRSEAAMFHNKLEQQDINGFIKRIEEQ